VQSEDTGDSDDPICDDALAALAILLRDDLDSCNHVIVARMQSAVELIPQLANHIVAAGGKRLRPLLTLAAARLCGYHDPAMRHVELAACVELIHTATLLHDDVVDASLLRRGLPSANAMFGNRAPVLVGDYLFARAFEIIVSAGSLRVLRIFADATATIALGEVVQLTTQNELATSASVYLEVIKGKTAALFATACQIGAVVADRCDAEPALAEYGENLGIAFQLVDDALDYAADQNTLGKTVGDDFREGKVTLPVLIAYERGGTAERAFWERTIGLVQQHEGDLNQALAFMRARDSIGATFAQAGHYARQARQALTGFPATLLRNRLCRVADYTVSRSH
jgi:octaprenyl-diphosphate synthase